MIEFERMNDSTTKGYALGIAYNTRVKTVWLMCIFFMVVFKFRIGEEHE